MASQSFPPPALSLPRTQASASPSPYFPSEHAPEAHRQQQHHGAQVQPLDWGLHLGLTGEREGSWPSAECGKGEDPRQPRPLASLLIHSFNKHVFLRKGGQCSQKGKYSIRTQIREQKGQEAGEVGWDGIVVASCARKRQPRYSVSGGETLKVWCKAM